jgi:hypothetical protein
MYDLSCIWALEAYTHIIYRLNSVYVIVYSCVASQNGITQPPHTRSEC